MENIEKVLEHGDKTTTLAHGSIKVNNWISSRRKKREFSQILANKQASHKANNLKGKEPLIFSITK